MSLDAYKRRAKLISHVLCVMYMYILNHFRIEG